MTREKALLCVTNYRGLGWVLQRCGLVLDSFNPLTYNFEEQMPHNPEVEVQIFDLSWFVNQIILQ